MKRDIVLVFLLCNIISIGSVEIVGFKTTLSQRGIEYMKDVGLEVLESQLSSISIPDIDGDADTPIGHVSYKLTNIVMQSLSIPDSTVTLVPSTAIQLNTQDMSAKMKLDWQYREDSFPHVSDHGTADVTVSSTSLGIQIDVGEKSGLPVATTTGFNVSIGKLDIDLHGGASWLYNWFIGEFSGKIKDSAESALKSQMPPTINKGLASAFSSLPVEEKVSAGIEINYQLEQAPYVTAKSFTLSTLGEFFDIKDPHNAPFTPTSLPDIATSEMVQMFVSDFSVNSASYVLYTEKQMQVMITDSMLPADAPLRLNTTYFIDLIPAFAKAYPDQMFNLFIAASNVPRTTFALDGASVQADGILQAIMVHNSEVAFTISAKVLTAGKAAISAENITGQLSFVNMTLAFENSTFGAFDVSTLNQIAADLVTAGILPQANKILGAGFPLPTITGLTLVKPSIGWGDGYLYVSSDATYSPPSKDNSSL